MLRKVLRLWALSLLLSVVITAAGDRWPEALTPNALVVALLVLAPPLLMLLWLLLNWRLDEPLGAGSGDGGESQQCDRVDS